MRLSQRLPHQLRPIHITRHYTRHAPGSVLMAMGDTQVLCTATLTEGVPRFLYDKRQKQGWLTAEYSMLPGSTNHRTQREASQGKVMGRTVEIQRLIGRTLRSAIDLSGIPNMTLYIDCDVIQADGGTRCAAINGGCIALFDAIDHLLKKGKIKHNPLRYLIGALSVGIHQHTPMVDLDQHEDNAAQTDMNIIMTAHGDFVEIQGTAEKNPLSEEQLRTLTSMAKTGIADIITLQKKALNH